MHSTLQITSVVICIYLLALAPISAVAILYAFKLYFTNKSQSLLHKRLKPFVALAICSGANLCIVGPIEALDPRYPINNDDTFGISPIQTILVQEMLVVALMFTITWTLLNTLFNIKRTLDSREWVQAFSNESNFADEWKQKKKWWNKIVGRFFMLSILLLSLILVTVDYLAGNKWAGRMLMALISCLFIFQQVVYHVYTKPIMNELHFLLYEMNMYTKIVASGMFIIVITCSVIYIRFESNEIEYFNYLFITFVSVTSTFIYYCFTTIYLPIKNPALSKGMDSCINNINDILQNPIAFRSLMGYMGKTACAENGLFFVVMGELSIFMNNNNMIIGGIEFMNGINISQTIPTVWFIENRVPVMNELRKKYYFVYDDTEDVYDCGDTEKKPLSPRKGDHNSSEKMRNCLCDLYGELIAQYISNDSTFEINISYACRYEITTTHNEMLTTENGKSDKKLHSKMLICLKEATEQTYSLILGTYWQYCSEINKESNDNSERIQLGMTQLI